MQKHSTNWNILLFNFRLPNETQYACPYWTSVTTRMHVGFVTFGEIAVWQRSFAYFAWFTRPNVMRYFQFFPSNFSATSVTTVPMTSTVRYDGKPKITWYIMIKYIFKIWDQRCSYLKPTLHCFSITSCRWVLLRNSLELRAIREF